ncbi:hypothetical protein [Leptospira stimsonii]|uniref:DUF3303 domain-containing protein n=1 Tax=Leptospira stimsonii TaxID=2202203 RepID=A0ABY2MV10_9LEPT|nr:hypothetical protein [Leptospira stimsonii]TGK25376.1 hypothetical protein EHO98_02970 [Leptospira stimsonii]TGM08795.1 hypothetical protein EHQ90_22155 [Leptospira stimsonii]
MPNVPAPLKVYLFRLKNWSIEKENTLIEKFEAYGLNDLWQGYEVPNHPEIKGVYMVPDETSAKTQVERLVSEAVTLDMKILGSFDPFEVPESVFGISKEGIPISYILAGIIILLLIWGVLR